MNTQALTAIAEWLENPAPQMPSFSMEEGIMETRMETGEAECRTTCCIAGAAVLFADIDLPMCSTEFPQVANANWREVERTAIQILGLDWQTADELFMPPDMEEIDREWAARTVRHLIATGKVDWEATK